MLTAKPKTDPFYFFNNIALVCEIMLFYFLGNNFLENGCELLVKGSFIVKCDFLKDGLLLIKNLLDDEINVKDHILLDLFK
jgi:hypothetical protein